MKQYDYTPVFKLDLAGWLMQKGFVLHYCKRNDQNPHRIVYYFMSSNTLDTAISDYLYMHNLIR